jgi:hypothetical protein
MERAAGERGAHLASLPLLLHHNQSNKSTAVYLIERKIFLAPRFFQGKARLAHPAKFTRGQFALIRCFGAAGFDAESGKKWLAHFKDLNSRWFSSARVHGIWALLLSCGEETGVWEF